jgi:hypothetical protein
MLYVERLFQQYRILTPHLGEMPRRLRRQVNRIRCRHPVVSVGVTHGLIDEEGRTWNTITMLKPIVAIAEKARH